MWFGERAIKTCFLFSGYCQLIQENLDNVSCCKMKEKSISSDNGIPDITGRRTVPTMLVLDHISSLEGTARGSTGRRHHCRGLKLYLVKVTATEVDIGLVNISLSPESLEKLLMYTEFFRIITKETGC